MRRRHAARVEGYRPRHCACDDCQPLANKFANAARNIVRAFDPRSGHTVETTAAGVR